LDSDNEDDQINPDMDLGDYHQSGDYIFDADLFNCDKFQNKFNPNGTPKDDTIMNQQGAIQETTLQQNFPNWTNSRVVNITPTTIARYIPLPYTVDPYMRTLLQPAQDQSLDRNDSNEEGDNPMEIENNQNNAGMINNEHSFDYCKSTNSKKLPGTKSMCFPTQESRQSHHDHGDFAGQR